MTRNEWDVIVVGARIAGCGAAIRFADSGYRVLVIDKGREGSDTLSTHGFGGENPMPQLKQLGVLDEVQATDAPPLTHFRMDYDDGSIAVPIMNEWGYTLSVRRITLDPILVERSRAAGADVRFDTTLVELVREGGRVAGILVNTPDGRKEEHQARLVIGADGRHSQVAQLAGAESYDEVGSPTSAMYAYFDNVAPLDKDHEVLQYAMGPGCDSIVGPSDGGVACILLILANDDFKEMRTTAAESFDSRLRTIPAVAPRLSETRRVTKVRPAGTREVDGKFRHPWGPGWALVGDAGLKAHPAAGRGIGDGLRCTEILHSAVDGAWRSGGDVDKALTNFHTQRDIEFKPAYDFSFALAGLNALNNGGVQKMMADVVRIQAARAVAEQAVAAAGE